MRKLFRRLSKIVFSIILALLDRSGVDTNEIISRMLGQVHQRGKLNQWLADGDPTKTRSCFYVQYVPDRYFDNLKQYRDTINLLSFDDLRAWVHENNSNNSGDISRFFFLNLCADILIQEKLDGDIVELGVYRGNSAAVLSKVARRMGRKCYLFDTFAGFDHRDLVGRDKEFQTSTFAGTSLEKVKAFVSAPDCAVFVQGYFPESLAQIGAIDNLVLVHIDCDLEKPFTEALKFFYPRLRPGGFLIMHDYASLHWPGAQHAVDEFLRDKPESIIPIPDKSGTCVVRKLKSLSKTR
jgi:O-methyltransferase